MELAWILLLIALIALIAIAIAVPFYFFSYAFERSMPLDLSDPEQTKNSSYAYLSEEIAKGKAYVKTLDREHWEIKSTDGLTLRGSFFPTKEEKPRGVILLMHGYHSESIQDFCCVFPFYQGLGYHLLCVHQRAHGDSDGEYTTFGDRERYDCALWIEKIVERFGPAFPIFLDGISMGATTVMLASAMEHKGNVCGIIADCGFTSPLAEFTHVLKMQFHLPAFPLIPLVQIIARKRLSIDFAKVDTVEAMKHCRYPILFVHGTGDDFVPHAMTIANYEACVSEKRMVLVKDAGHGGSYVVDRVGCEKELKAFLDRNTPIR